MWNDIWLRAESKKETVDSPLIIIIIKQGALHVPTDHITLK
jgi:hypothetical protein